ncbi:MAG: DUF2442 domain-containing protein [Elusimicrobia bacterium]|nr:DUF2442 domain-containing protein [Candidatus Obscuribacterium magneticum]MCB4756379.1 DUF2442 domain-containing protein [Candidatus Obscuribacterium magneticum]
MKSSKRGKNISKAEVLDISGHGVWIFINGKEYFLPYEDFPWFKKAKVSDIHNLKLFHGSHLFWPNLDVDLDLSSLQDPSKYPMIYK